MCIIYRVPEGLAILATGPLTSDALSEAIRRRFGDHFLSYFDAASPIVLYESIDLETCFRAGRYGQEADYLNCPLTEEEYRRFYQALLEAEEHTPHEWEKREFFEACVPVEELARRGYQTLLFGPMKPVGLKDPRTGKEPFAVVQLRQEDKAGRMWSLVGFQTGLKWPEQKRLIQMIPGLENAEIVRYGVMHRPCWVLLNSTTRFSKAALGAPPVKPCQSSATTLALAHCSLITSSGLACWASASPKTAASKSAFRIRKTSRESILPALASQGQAT
jgi:tRNA:m(5)U-54 methyltransferase